MPQFVQAGAQTSDTGAEAFKPDPGSSSEGHSKGCVPVSGSKVQSLVGLSAFRRYRHVTDQASGEHGRPQKFFQGAWQGRYFACLFQFFGDATQMDVHKKCPMLRQRLHTAFSL